MSRHSPLSELPPEVQGLLVLAFVIVFGILILSILAEEYPEVQELTGKAVAAIQLFINVGLPAGIVVVLALLAYLVYESQKGGSA